MPVEHDLGQGNRRVTAELEVIWPPKSRRIEDMKELVFYVRGIGIFLASEG